MLNINALEVLFTFKMDLPAEQGGVSLEAQHLGGEGKSLWLFPDDRVQGQLGL